MKQLFYNCTILTGKEGQIIENGYLLVEDGLIIEIGTDGLQHKDNGQIKKTNLLQITV